MCYSRCPYENYFGDCVIKDKWDGEKYRYYLDGVEIEHYPDDAHCTIIDKLIDEESELLGEGGDE